MNHKSVAAVQRFLRRSVQHQNFGHHHHAVNNFSYHGSSLLNHNHDHQHSICSSLSCSRLPNSNAHALYKQQRANYTSASNDVDSPEFYCVKHVPTCAISTVILRPTRNATTGYEVLLIQRGNKHGMFFL